MLTEEEQRYQQEMQDSICEACGKRGVIKMRTLQHHARLPTLRPLLALRTQHLPEMRRRCLSTCRRS